MGQKQKTSSKNSLANAFDSFNMRVSDLGDSYRELTNKIEKLNLEISKKNRQLEDNFYEVNKLRLFFDSILNSMIDGVIVVDTSGTVVLFNRGAEILTGVSGKQTIGKHYNKLFDKSVSNRFSPLYTLSSGKALLLEEKEMHISNGKILPVRYSTSLVQDSSNNILGAVEVFSDLTRIKHLEDEMQQVRTQTALNQMAVLVSHEIRNPLGGIRGYVDLIAESLDKDDPIRNMIDHVISSVTLLDEIVSKFQIYTRPVKPHFDDVEFTEFVKDVTEFFTEKKEFVKRNIRVIIKNGIKKPVNVRLDPILFEQVIISILDNSFKAMKNGGTLRINISKNNTRLAGNSAVSLTISDSGSGMESEISKKAFVPFFTTREKGLGLGLALAKNFVSLHRGQICLESEKNIGTTVKIFLPME
ncbi:PAS domain S-box protein [bacterium]|nr:PAS domain S-box protein [bacterium]